MGVLELKRCCNPVLFISIVAAIFETYIPNVHRIQTMLYFDKINYFRLWAKCEKPFYILVALWCAKRICVCIFLLPVWISFVENHRKCPQSVYCIFESSGAVPQPVSDGCEAGKVTSVLNFMTLDVNSMINFIR